MNDETLTGEGEENAQGPAIQETQADEGTQEAKGDEKTQSEADGQAAQDGTQEAVVIFQSKESEPTEYAINGIRAFRATDNRLRWRVPVDGADRFAKHHHVMTGRVVRTEG